MASPDLVEPDETAGDTSDTFQQDENPATESEERPCMHDDGLEYFERSATESVPTKFGDEHDMSDGAASERPVSAGTIHTATDFEGTEDAAILAEFVATPKDHSTQDSAYTAEPTSSLQLLCRDVLDDGGAVDSFAFTKATRPNMNLTGNHKVPTTVEHNSTALNIGQSTDESWPATAAKEVSHMDDAIPTPAAVETEDMQTLDQEVNGQPDVTTMIEQPSKERRMGRKSRQRHRTPAPRQEATEDSFHPMEEPENVRAHDEAPHTGNDLVADQQADVQMADDDQQAGYDERPSTPQQVLEEEHQAAHPSSPHEQLNADLEADAGGQWPETIDLTPTPHSKQELEEHIRQPSQQPPSSPRQPQVAQQDDRDEPQEVYSAQHGPFVQQDAPKRSRRRPARQFNDNTPTEEPTAGPMDFLNIVAFQIRNMKGECDKKILTVEQKASEELQAVVDEKQRLIGELRLAEKTRQETSGTIEAQKGKQKKQETMMEKAKKCINGLQNDLNQLSQRANASRQQLEKLSEAGRSQAASITVLNACYERAVEGRDEAFAACRQSQHELDACKLTNEYLTKQLSDHAGLLSEERDRSSQLYRQLASAAQGDDKVLGSLKSNTDKILDKLHEVDAALELGREDKTVIELLRQTFDAVQETNSGNGDAIEHIISLRTAVEKSMESMAQKFETVTALVKSEQSSHDNISQVAIDSALSKLSHDMFEALREMEKDGEHRDTIAALREQLKASDLRRNDVVSQLTTSRQAEAELIEQNRQLSTRLSTIQNRSSPVNDAETQLNDAQAEVESTRKALLSAKTDMARNADEIQTLGGRNTDLQEQLSDLQHQLQKLQSQGTEFERERQELVDKAWESEQQVRREMREHVEQVELKVRSEAKNDLKKLSSERDRFQSQVASLQVDLETSNAHTQQLQQDKSVNVAKQQELDRLEEYAKAQKDEIATLQASIAQLQVELKDRQTTKEEYTALGAKYAAEQSQLQTVVAENLELNKQVEDLQRSVDEVKTTVERTRGELDKSRTEHDAAIRAHRQEAVEGEQKTAAGWQHYKLSCDKTIQDANKEADQKLKALQDSLAEVQAEKKQVEADAETFRTEVDHSWQQEQETNHQKSSETKRKISELETERDDARNDVKRICLERDTTMEAQRNAFSEQLKQMEQRAQAAEAKCEQLQDSFNARKPEAAASTKRITPTGCGSKSTEPQKPRKKIDRNTNSVVVVGSIPAPEQLRPDSRRTHSAGSRMSIRGAIVEESQHVNDPFAVQPLGERVDRFSPVPDLEDILTIKGGAFAQPPAMVDETQHDDLRLPFTDWEGDLSPVCSIKPVTALPDAAPSFGPFQTNRNADTQQMTGFSVYEDSQDMDEPFNPADLVEYGNLQDTVLLSEAEKDKYTFHKLVPQPNSASKRVQPSEVSQVQKRGHSNGQITTQPSRSQAQTPLSQTYNKAKDNQAGPRSSQSSSPGFVQDSQSNRRQSTYTLGGSGGKRRLSQSKSVSVADPRLSQHSQTATQKRKPDANIAQGYEQERKKRMTAAPSRAGSSSGAPDPSSQSSTRGSNPFPTMTAGPRGSSQYDSGNSRAPTHMRTLGGTKSRPQHGSKKGSRSDQYTARFSQEFSGH